MLKALGQWSNPTLSYRVTYVVRIFYKTLHRFLIASSHLPSPAYIPTVNSSIVRFINWYDTEAVFDGGVLENSIATVNNGAFQNILVAGGV